jgi:hypothetical protein
MRMGVPADAMQSATIIGIEETICSSNSEAVFA